MVLRFAALSHACEKKEKSVAPGKINDMQEPCGRGSSQRACARGPFSALTVQPHPSFHCARAYLKANLRGLNAVAAGSGCPLHARARVRAHSLGTNLRLPGPCIRTCACL